MAVKNLRINEQIRVQEVRLITESGEQEVLSFTQALAMAQEESLDLVEVAPNANPPVCKILDYGKYKFEQEKRLRQSKKNQTVVKLKEVRMQPKIDSHDLAFKAKHVGSFLSEGNKVKVTIRFRGRELAHTEIGRDILLRILDILTEKEIAYSVDSQPRMEGRFMSMMLSPGNKKKK